MKHVVKKIVEISGKRLANNRQIIGKISSLIGIFLTKCKTLNTKKKLNIFGKVSE